MLILKSRDGTTAEIDEKELWEGAEAVAEVHDRLVDALTEATEYLATAPDKVKEAAAKLASWLEGKEPRETHVSKLMKRYATTEVSKSVDKRKRRPVCEGPLGSR